MRLIEIRNVTKVFKTGFFSKDVVALKNLTLSIEKGEVYGFIGPNGAGKSTTIKLLMGIIKPTSGIILINGVSSTDFRSRRSVGFLPESPHFYDYLTGFEFMKLSGSIMGGFGSRIASGELKECLEMVGLKDAMHKTIRKYSLGMVQRLGIAQAVLGNPEIMIFDEPLSSLDPFGRRDVKLILDRLKNQGETIFFSSHIIHDVEKIATRVGIIKNGSMLAEGALPDLTEKGSLEEFFVHETNKSYCA